MSTWFVKEGTEELNIKNYDDTISFMASTDKPDTAICVHMTYKEFMDLASWLGFDVVPRDYRKELSDL